MFARGYPAKRDPTPIRRPCRVQVRSGIRRQAQGQPPIDADDANVDVRVILLFAIPDESHLAAIGREGR
jgi:hypothetical protein